MTNAQSGLLVDAETLHNFASSVVGSQSELELALPIL